MAKHELNVAQVLGLVFESVEHSDGKVTNMTNRIIFFSRNVLVTFSLRGMVLQDRLVKGFKSLPNDKILHESKLEAYADDI